MPEVLPYTPPRPDRTIQEPGPSSWYYTADGYERYVWALRHQFGLNDFRPGQLALIERIMEGEHVLCVMPTGYGKSLCYQLPALLREGTTVVVSPLVALMKDQVDALRAKGFDQATFINGSIPPNEQRSRLAQMRNGAYKLVYISPERFRNRAFLGALSKVPLSLFVIDEAHCISQWGHDFRPDYLILSNVIQRLGRPQVAAFTATATQEVRRDIREQIGIPDLSELVLAIGRKNLQFRVLPVSEDRDKLLWIQHLISTLNGKGIIYTGRRREAEWVHAFLRCMGVRSEYFHAQRTEAEKRTIQDRFMNDQHPESIDVVVATNAFGLGVDKPNVRLVIHYTLPGTVEAYYQEAGRAGRDDQPAVCALLYSHDDRALQEWFIQDGLVRRALLLQIYEAIFQAEGFAQFRILSREDLEWRIRIKGTKLRVGLGHLEALGFLKRFPDVLTDMRVYLSKENWIQPMTGIRGRLARILVEDSHIDLGTFCATHGFDPRQVMNILYDLQFEGKLHWEGGQRALLFQIDRSPEELRQWTDEELGVEAYRQGKYKKLQAMLEYATTHTCRNLFIRQYFGEDAEKTCGICDNCRASALGKEQTRERSRSGKHAYFDAAPLTKALLLTIQDTHFGIGKSTAAAILTGSKSKTIIENDLHHLRSYRSFPFFRREAIVEHIVSLIRTGLLAEQRPVDFDYPVLKITEPGRHVLSQPDMKQIEVRAWENIEPTHDTDIQLFEALKRWRSQTATRLNRPAYIVFHDRVLKRLAVLRPMDSNQWRKIKGIGEKHTEQYGHEVLNLLREHRGLSQEQGPFTDEDGRAVDTFLRAQSHKPLKGDFDLGFALDDHTVVRSGKRSYTTIGQMVHAYKYSGQESLADPLSDEMATFLRDNKAYRDLDIVVAVPSTQKDRTYDPVSRLAKALSKTCHIPFSPRALAKARPTRPQKDMENLTQKTRNVRGAFRVEDKEAVRGKTILLLDDLYDSGATLNECTKALKEAGANKVLVLTLTRTTHTVGDGGLDTSYGMESSR